LPSLRATLAYSRKSISSGIRRLLNLDVSPHSCNAQR
jgi:hypothetical protein